MAPTTIPATNVSIQVAGDAVQRGFQRAGFFALGRHWVFFIREGVIPVLVFDSSVGDSGVWSGETATGIILTDGAEFSLTLQEVSPTVAYAHLVWSDATGANPLWYMRGLLASNGNITPDAPQQVVAADPGWEYENPGITLNASNDLLFAVYTKVNIADPSLCTPYLTMSITVNGTWTTGAGYPTQLTAVNDAAWVPLVAPYGSEVITVYAFDSGSIYSRLLAGGILGAQVDSGVVVGTDAGKMSLVARRITSGGSFLADAAFLAYQGTDWDLYCITYELGWGAAVTIQSIGNFRQANPLLSIMNYGDEDTTDHGLATLYCFWTPTTDIPTAEWVTYRVSRDQNTTWTNEAGADAAEEWIDETASGFEVQQSGSVYAFNSEDYDNDDARSYIGIVYVTHTMPSTLRHAALGFADPTEDLAAEFYVGQFFAEDLAAAFVVRHSSPEDIGAPDLPAKFSVEFGEADLLGEAIVRHPASEDLAAKFFRGADADEEFLGKFDIRSSASQDLAAELNVRHPDSEDLLGEFAVRRSDAEELLGVFVVRQSDSEDLLGVFEISRDDWISQGLNVSVYRDLGVVS
jgi:hypothetical protein